MRRILLCLTAFTLATGPAATEAQTGGTQTTRGRAMTTTSAVPVTELVRRVDIPYRKFTLANGLRVLVHEDRKAPIVAVSVWYNVGSKDEPKGKTGFAHLFEHLMFNGSENAPGDFFDPLRTIGATDLNGTTWFYRTNYFETVPTPALERALFLEADRMGRLLGAVTQEKLTNQIGVVQNEKRQGDNEPYGLVEYAELEALFPEGHPYRHSTIGSMADLSAATLDTVKTWFRDKYGPNNAVLVLAGDVDVATARRLVEKQFGDIPRGPVNTPAAASVPTLPAPKTEVMKDRVAQTRIYRTWAVPGMLDKDAAALDVAASVLGGLSSSRLDNILVRKEQLATAVAAYYRPYHRVGMLQITADVKPGGNADAVAARLDQIVADYIRTGPTEDEVRRVAVSEAAARIRGLEQVGGFGGKAVALAEGELYAGDPEFYKKQLLALGRVTPADARRVMQKWMTRPVYALRVEPGERPAYQEAATQTGAPAGSAGAGGGSMQRPRYYRTPAQGEQMMAPEGHAPRTFSQAGSQTGSVPTAVQPRPLPDVAEVSNLDFPDVQRATLSNGMRVTYARRTAVPVTRVAVEFNAGIAADPQDKLGTQSLMLNLLDEGTTTRDSIRIAEEQERLGAEIGSQASMDRTAVTLAALTPNLAPSLDLLADVVKNPAFAPAEVERLRAQQLAGIAQELTVPQAIAYRTLPRVLFGEGHPYGKPLTGSGDPKAVAAVTRDDLRRFHASWIRPDNAEIFAVGDLPLAQLVPMLEARFGDWRAPAGAIRGVKAFTATPPAARQRIVLIDRPQSPQSVILAGANLPLKGSDDIVPLTAANEALGGNFLSRLNMDLRETKGWSYGVNGRPNLFEQAVPYIISAPVQADRTGESVAAILSNIREFTTSKGITQTELERAVNGNTRGLSGSFETAGAVLGALRTNALYKRPDNYYETLAARYRTLQAPALDTTARAVIRPQDMVFVIVGDAAKIRPQLEKLGLPIETMAIR